MELLLADSSAHLEWAVAALFYVVVHLGRAVAIHGKAGPVTSHRAFETILRRDLSAPQSVYDAYRTLKDESEAARYDCARYKVAEVRKLEKDCLPAIEEWARVHLGLASSPLA